MNKIKLSGLILGPLSFIVILLFIKPNGLSDQGIATLACAAWISIWWITEAIPISATALLPLILFPLTGVLEI